MIILDTNVVSEQMRRAPEPGVTAWLDAQPADEILITAITAAELRAGAAVLPTGRRKAELNQKIESLLQGIFAKRIVAFSAVATPAYAAIVSARRAAGRPISIQDALIAAVCRAHGLTLATRNTADFDSTGVDLVNPWAA